VHARRCLIAGPEGSPYAGGLFEFDIFLPLGELFTRRGLVSSCADSTRPSLAKHPQTSPLVWLMTTGKGQCRFNPNLYAEGKVCLSLLGTWSGARVRGVPLSSSTRACWATCVFTHELTAHPLPASIAGGDVATPQEHAAAGAPLDHVHDPRVRLLP